MVDPFGRCANMSSDVGNTALDTLGLIPFLGAVSDTANAVWYAFQGKWGYAGLSLVNAIPFFGDFADSGKIAKDAVDIEKDAKSIYKIGEEAESVSKGAAEPAYASFRDLMSPDEVARYDKYWTGLAERISNEALDNQINFIKNGGITKPGGGAYKPTKINSTVDMNTGDISYGYNGSNKFNPSRNTLKPELQSLIDNTKSLEANDFSNPYAARNSYEL